MTLATQETQRSLGIAGTQSGSPRTDQRQRKEVKFLIVFQFCCMLFTMARYYLPNIKTLKALRLLKKYVYFYTNRGVLIIDKNRK